MASLDDFEVLSILGTNLNSTCYKVRNKLTNEIFVWKAINFEKYQNTKELLDRFNVRKLQQHPTLLQFYDYILHEETDTIYFVTEYCKHGCLFNIIQKCLRFNEYIDEDFIWICLYKLALYFKINKELYLNIHEVFIDVDLNIKLLNFTVDLNKSANNVYDLGILMHMIVYLDTRYNKMNIFPEYYSNGLKQLLDFMTNLNDDVTPSIDAILCHPTVLLKASVLKSREIFIKNPKLRLTPEIPEKQNVENISLEEMYQTKLENLRNREYALKINEDKLKERCHILDRREKKIALMERMVKEKTARAELYLKRARDLKSTNSGSNKDLPKKQLNTQQDTSFSADCGDNSILPTSKKLNIQEIVKPPKFTRTLSERRVRFKSHSPLKEIHNIKREIIRNERQKNQCPGIKEQPRRELKATLKLDSLQSDSDKASESNSEKCAIEKIKKKSILSTMFNKKSKKPNSIASSSDSVSVHTYEDLDNGWTELKEDVQPINWTSENKKQAFDLLRIMNGECNINEIKHTFL